MFGRTKRSKFEARRRQASQFDPAATTFLRSRTLVGSASSRIRAASEERGDVVSDRVKMHTLMRRRRKIQVMLGCCSGVSLIVLLLLQGAMSQVKFVAVTPIDHPLDTTSYQQAWREYTAKRPVESIRYFLNGKDWLAFLSSRYPEVRALQIEAPTVFGSHSMALELRRPVAVWRVGIEALYVDGEGTAFKHNYFAEPGVAVIDESGINGVLAQQAVASTQTMAFIGQVVAKVEETGKGKIEKIILPPGLLRQIDFYVAGRAYRIKANLTREPGYQAADIVAALEYVDSRRLQPEYLDLRVASKLFLR